MRACWALLLIAASAVPAIASAGSGLHAYVEGEVIVKFRNEYTASAHADTVKRLGGKTLQVLSQTGGALHHVKTRAGVSVQQALDEFSLQSAVEYAQPNYIYHASAVPNDPMYAQEWGFKNTGQTIATGDYTTANPGTAGKDMSLESAWSVTTDCSSVTVAVVDTGINYNHSDLAANMWTSATAPNHGWNFVDGNNDPMDKNGHGTHVAGTIGAIGNNGIGTTGVCWKASLMAVRVLDATGSGTTATITQGVNYAVQNGAKVINMSLGGGSADAAFEQSIQNAGSSGVAVVVAAGNNGSDNDATPTYPCNYTESNLVCVAALDQSFALASFSNYGATSVDIGAPGTNILSSWPGTNANITDTFNTAGTLNWTKVGTGWGYQSKTFTVGGVPTPLDLISVPTNWDGSTTTYGTNMDTHVYKTFNTNGAATVTLNFQLFIDTVANQDTVSFYYNAAGGDPITNGTQLDSGSGAGGSNSIPLSYDITPCATSTTCSVGYRFTSMNTAGKHGVAIIEFSLDRLILGTTGSNTLDGTSMATPHVAGLMAMILAFNPAYGVAEAKQALLGGGVTAAALSGKTTSGKAANALGALSYIAPPTGVTATLK